MVNYFLQDIGLTTSGDIRIGAGGDVELADSYDTMKTAVNFLVKTDRGQYKPDIRVGCDLGTFVGKQMYSETFQQMEQSVRANVSKFVLNPSDFQVHVMPLDQNNAGVFFVIGGSFFDENGNPLTDVRPEVLTYTYPFADGQPTLINVQST